MRGRGGGLAMERVPFHMSGVKNFYVALIFLEILCILLVTVYGGSAEYS